MIGQDFVGVTYLGGTATGWAQGIDWDATKGSKMMLAIKAQLDGEVAKRSDLGAGNHSGSLEQLTTNKFASLHVRGGNQSVQMRGLAGLYEWQTSLKLPHHGLEAVNRGAYGVYELIPPCIGSWRQHSCSQRWGALPQHPCCKPAKVIIELTLPCLSQYNKRL